MSAAMFRILVALSITAVVWIYMHWPRPPGPKQDLCGCGRCDEIRKADTAKMRPETRRP